MFPMTSSFDSTCSIFELPEFIRFQVSERVRRVVLRLKVWEKLVDHGDMVFSTLSNDFNCCRKCWCDTHLQNGDTRIWDDWIYMFDQKKKKNSHELNTWTFLQFLGTAGFYSRRSHVRSVEFPLTRCRCQAIFCGWLELKDDGFFRTTDGAKNRSLRSPYFVAQKKNTKRWFQRLWKHHN